MNASPAFRALLLAGEPVDRALDYVRPERGARRAEAEAMDRIRRRNARPDPMARSGASAAPDVSAMTEDELRRIDERVKRGERVVI